jgi:Caspase domain/Glucodextranase, domain B
MKNTIPNGIMYCGVLIGMIFLVSCAEAPLQVQSTLPPPSADKVRVYVKAYSSAYEGRGNWSPSDDVYKADQYHRAATYFGDIVRCEIINSKEEFTALGNRNPSRYQMERNDWALAKKIGRALNADYVVVTARWTNSIARSVNILVVLINVKTGKKYEAEQNKDINNTVVASTQLLKSAYTAVFKSARPDVLAAVQSKSLVGPEQKKTEHLAAIEEKAPKSTKPDTVVSQELKAGSEQKQTELPMAVNDKESTIVKPAATKNITVPVIHIALPDIQAGIKPITVSRIVVAGSVTSEQGVAEVYVNGINAGLDKDGNFSAEIFLKVGENEVIVAAVDTRGNMGTKNFKVDRQVRLAIPKEAAPPVIRIMSPAIQGGVNKIATSKLIVEGKATADRGVAEVYVNGKDANLDREGNFSAEILLKVGENEITVVAMDTLGNRGSQTFKMERQPQTIAKQRDESMLPSTQKPGKYYALIIGNNNYMHITKLETAQKDASDVEKILKSKYGFETKLLMNATRKDILDAINYFRKNLNENDNFLIYYAGHGEYDKRADKAYWLPVDAQTDSDTNWIIADDLTVNMKRISSRHVLVVADSCYSGAITRSVFINLKASGSREEYLKKMNEKPSRSLLASGGNEPVFDSGGSGHSVFADAFIKALDEVDKKAFTAEELFYGYIKERVAGKSEQVPEYNTIRNSGHDGGDFIFIKTGVN